MKLQRINKYVAGVMASFMIFSNTACSLDSSSDEDVVLDTHVEEEVKPVVRSFVIPSDEEIDNEISSYGDLDTNRYMSNIYKVLEISDKDQYYKVMVVSAKVDYITMDGNVVGNKYTVFDLFTKEELFTTSNLDTFEDMEIISEYLSGSRIISYSPISKLGSIARGMGASENYVNEVMNNSKQMSEREVAIMYVSLVPFGSRVNLNEFEYNTVKKIG